jgi:6-phosphofructokinase 2
MPMKPIVSLTLNPALDMSSEADEVRPIRKVRTSAERFDAGGGGINVTRVIHELAGRSFAVFLAGGRTGDALEDMLRDTGIGFHRVRTAGPTRVSHVVHERKSGLEFRFTPEGPVVAEAEWRAALDFLDMLDFGYLVASGSLPRGVPDGFYAELAGLVAAKGAKLVVDTSGTPLRVALERGVHLAKPSRGELESILGQRLDGPEAIEAAAREVVARYPVDYLAVTLGKDGAVFASRDLVRRVEAPEVEVRSAVGAGDSFVGAMTLRLAQGYEPFEAFLYGVAAGSATVLTPGTELCHKSDVEHLFAELRKSTAGAP